VRQHVEGGRGEFFSDYYDWLWHGDQSLTNEVVGTA